MKIIPIKAVALASLLSISTITALAQQGTSVTATVIGSNYLKDTASVTVNLPIEAHHIDNVLLKNEHHKKIGTFKLIPGQEIVIWNTTRDYVSPRINCGKVENKAYSIITLKIYGEGQTPKCKMQTIPQQQ